MKKQLRKLTSPREFNVIMLGSRRVGKTSLLTAMYHQYQRAIAKTAIELFPDPRTKETLEEKLKELQNLNETEVIYGEGEEGIPPTESPGTPDLIRSYIFDVKRKARKETPIRLHFWDYPGDYIEQESDDERYQSLKQRMMLSVVIIIVIDASALMEKKGKYFQDKTRAIQSIFEKVYRDVKINRLVMFAPVKCEKYMKNPEMKQKLIDAIKNQYEELLLFLKKDEQSIVIITPVQTVGTICFSYIEKEEEYPVFRWKKQDPDQEYSPEDNDQPLKYILRFVLKLYLEDKQRNILTNLACSYQYIKNSIKVFSQDCKTKDGFEIIQNEKLLNLK